MIPICVWFFELIMAITPWMKITACPFQDTSDWFCSLAYGYVAMLFFVKEGHCPQLWNNIVFRLGMPPTQMMADRVLVVWRGSWERLCPFHDNIRRHGGHTIMHEGFNHRLGYSSYSTAFTFRSFMKIFMVFPWNGATVFPRLRKVKYSSRYHVQCCMCHLFITAWLLVETAPLCWTWCADGINILCTCTEWSKSLMMHFLYSWILLLILHIITYFQKQQSWLCLYEATCGYYKGVSQWE